MKEEKEDQEGVQNYYSFHLGMSKWNSLLIPPPSSHLCQTLMSKYLFQVAKNAK